MALPEREGADLGQLFAGGLAVYERGGRGRAKELLSEVVWRGPG